MFVKTLSGTQDDKMYGYIKSDTCFSVIFLFLSIFLIALVLTQHDEQIFGVDFSDSLTVFLNLRSAESDKY